MTCREVEEREVLERYVLDRLMEPEREAFEQHYFECDSCFKRLTTQVALQEQLRAPFVRQKPRRGFFGQINIWVPVFAALVLLFAIGVWRYMAGRPQPQQAPTSALVSRPPLLPAQPHTSSSSLTELARVNAPPYSELVLRGAEDEAAASFRQAMRHYMKQDYTGAIPGLRAAVQGSPRTARFNFYLGACYLLTGRTDSSITSFRKVISLGDLRYSESAHFYLAKAYLQNKDVSPAEEELRGIIKLGGSRAAEAQEILRQLGK